MNFDTYLMLTNAIVGGIFVAFCVAVWLFLLTALAWRGPKRRPRLTRGGFVLLLIPMLFGIQQAVAHLIFLPSLDAEFEPVVDMMNDGFKTAVGDVAPPLTVTGDDGSIYVLSELRGSVVLVNFFGVECKPCVLEMPHIQEAFDRWSERTDFQVVAISAFDTPDAIHEFKAGHCLTFPVAVGRDKDVFRGYASFGVPAT